MGIQLKYRSPTGETRPWRLKEIIQGYPLGHPSHPMFVHFPVAFYTGCLALDVLSKLGDFPAAPLAATWAILGAFAGSLFAVTTGLVDWLGMAPGSKKRRWATKHMLLQLTTFAVFLVNLILRWGDRHQAETDVMLVVLDLIGVGILTVGQWFGGILVYQMGMRVRTAEAGERASGTGPDAPAG